ncbi:MAG: OmpA family protein [Cytophagaceae bacterium]|nr:OmpA family protein [Cytophagaceae bacterium]
MTVEIGARDEKTQVELTARHHVRAVVAQKEYTLKTLPSQLYTLTLDQTDTLVVTTSSAGYLTNEETIIIRCDTCAGYAFTARMEEDSVFTNLDVNAVFQLDNVYFDQSSYVLRPDSYAQLGKLVKTLDAFPKLKIEIAGYTDNVGDGRLNLILSQNRARVIREYLAEKAIARKRLRAEGYGDTNPAAPNDTEENKKKNRRVVFRVLEN